MWRSRTNESNLIPLQLANSETASVDVLVFFPQFCRCASVSSGTKLGRAVKSSANAESEVGNFSK